MSKEIKLLQKGKGTFYIEEARTHDKEGKPLKAASSGDRKVVLIVEVTDAVGGVTTVQEHLTLNAAWKIQNICKACNREDLFISNDHSLDNLEELEGERGECLLDIREAQNGYPSQTVIKKYKEHKFKTPAQVAKEEIPSYAGMDDEIPF